METRYCKLYIIKDKDPIIKKAKSGVPQGDPLSAYLFCLAMELVIDKLRKRFPHSVIYMDDFAIGHANG